MLFFNNVIPANCTALQGKVTHSRIYGWGAQIRIDEWGKKTHIWEDKESWVSVREVGREKVSIMKTQSTQFLKN